MKRALRWLGAGLLPAALIGLLVATSTKPAVVVAGTVAVGVHPSMIAVDMQTHRAFVTNSHDDSVSVLDTRTGAPLRTVPVVAYPLDVVVDARTSRAFVVNAIADMSVLDTVRGAVLYSSNIGFDGGTESDMVVAEAANRVLVASSSSAGGLLTILDAHSGAVLHRVHIGSSVACVGALAVAVDERTGQAFVSSSGDRAVSIVALSTGHVLRTVPVGGSPGAVAVDERVERVYVSTSNTGIDAGAAVNVLDARSGTVLHTVAVGANPGTIAVDSRLGHAFVLTENGTSMLDGLTGAVLRSVPAGPPDGASAAHLADVVVDTRASRAFVINASVYDDKRNLSYESVSLLDTRSGRLLRRVPVGQSPSALAVDAAAGHVFVVNRYGQGPNSSSSTTGDMWGWLPRAVRQRLPWLPHPASSTDAGSVTVLDTVRL